jgi:hypothetical protein
MKGPLVNRSGNGRLRRSPLIFAVAGATVSAALVSAALLTATAAEAVTGSQPGSLTFKPASGPVTLKPTWSTNTACPAGYQTSADLFVLNTNGSVGSVDSATVLDPTAPFSGTLLASIGQSLSLGTNVKPGQSSEWVVACWSGPGGTGKVQYVQAAKVTLSADGKSYSSSAGSAPASAQQKQSVSWVMIALVIAAAIVVVGAFLGWQQRRRRLRATAPPVPVKARLG